MTVRSITQETEVSRFLYYFFLCLCKSFKELFLQCLSATFSAKADAKVQQISEPPKLFRLFLNENKKVFALIDNAKTSTPYYIYKGESLISSSKDSQQIYEEVDEVEIKGQGTK